MKILVLNLPSPPYLDIVRDSSGGFGDGFAVRRPDFGHTDKPYLNSFLPYANGILEKTELEFGILDCIALKSGLPRVLTDVKKADPDVIVSHISLPSLKKDLELMNQIKSILPNTRLVATGPVCKVLADEILSESKIDFLLQDKFPYVYNLQDIIQTIQNEKLAEGAFNIAHVSHGKIIANPPNNNSNFSDLPPPSYSALELSKYNKSFIDSMGDERRYLPIVVSIGCPYECEYCPVHISYGYQWQPRSPESIASEIEYLYSEHGIRGFLFAASSFTINRKHAEKICDEIIDRNLDIGWFCEARANEVSEQLLEKMSKAGCKRIHFGVETGDEQMIKEAKIGVDLNIVLRAFKATKQRGMLANAHIIFGLRGESQNTMKKTAIFLSKLNADDVFVNFAVPYPGTKLFEDAVRKGLIVSRDWSRYTTKDVVMRTNYLSELDLFNLKNKITKDLQKHKLQMLFLQLLKNLNDSRRLKYLSKEIVYTLHEIIRI